MHPHTRDSNPQFQQASGRRHRADRAATGIGAWVVFLFAMARQPLVGQGLLTVENSRSHSVTLTTLGRTPLDE